MITSTDIEGAQAHLPDVIHGPNDPVYGEGATAVLKGNLAPNGCVIKPAAADQRTPVRVPTSTLAAGKTCNSTASRSIASAAV